MGGKRRQPTPAARDLACVLVGPRVRLRPYLPSDHDSFVALFTNPRVMAHVDGPMSTERADRLFRAHLGIGADYPRLRAGFAVELTGSSAYLGTGSLLRSDDEQCIEVGYLLREQYWAQGFATEVATLLLAHAHDTLGCQRLVATVDADHPASIRVLDKIGMRQVRLRTDDGAPFFVYESLR